MLYVFKSYCIAVLPIFVLYRLIGLIYAVINLHKMAKNVLSQVISGHQKASHGVQWVDSRLGGPTTNINIGRFQGKCGAIGRNWSFFKGEI